MDKTNTKSFFNALHIENHYQHFAGEMQPIFKFSANRINNRNISAQPPILIVQHLLHKQLESMN